MGIPGFRDTGEVSEGVHTEEAVEHMGTGTRLSFRTPQADR